MSDRYNAAWLLGGAAIGWVAGRWSGGNCAPGAYNGAYNHCAPAYPQYPAPAYPYPVPGYGVPGYGFPGNDRPPHEDRQDDRIACIQAQLAAIGVSDKKNEEIDALRYRLGREITSGDIYKATCHKPDGKVYLPPTTLAEPYHSERNVIATYPEHRGDYNRGRGNDRCNKDCCDSLWY